MRSLPVLDALGSAANACIPSLRETGYSRTYRALFTTYHLRISSDAEWPPSSSNESNSEVIGLLHDILQRLPPAQEHEREASHALPVISLAFTAVDHVFGWPVFDANRADDWAPFCVLAATKMQDFQHKASSAIGTQQLDWDEIPALLTKFLRMAHTMNPILDCTTLMRYGRAVAELGPQWDARTCLVVSFCSLFHLYVKL